MDGRNGPPSISQPKNKKKMFERGKQLYHDGFDMYREIQCSSAHQLSECTSIYHTHRATLENKDRFCCWHCCHPFDGHIFKAPNFYDVVEKKYYVYGNFCSLSCIKTYVDSSIGSLKYIHQQTLIKMAKEIYKMEDIRPAPPRQSLKMFGGPYSIEDFRKKENIILLQPAPFVNYQMVVEEKLSSSDHNNRKSSTQKASVMGMSRPSMNATRYDVEYLKEESNENMYDAFVKSKESSSTEKMEESTKTQSKETTKKSEKKEKTSKKDPPLMPNTGIEQFLKK